MLIIKLPQELHVVTTPVVSSSSHRLRLRRLAPPESFECSIYIHLPSSPDNTKPISNQSTGVNWYQIDVVITPAVHQFLDTCNRIWWRQRRIFRAVEGSWRRQRRRWACLIRKLSIVELTTSQRPIRIPEIYRHP